VYVWGSGPGLGCGPDTVSLRPRLIEELQAQNVTDVVCGDSHCLVLTVGVYYCYYDYYYYHHHTNVTNTRTTTTTTTTVSQKM